MSVDIQEEHGYLAGVRVIDFTHVIAGPLCTQLLADAGATVVKVEPPGGEWGRRNGARGVAPGATMPYFAAVNRSKQSIVLDLRSDAGRKTATNTLRLQTARCENSISTGTTKSILLGEANFVIYGKMAPGR